MARITVEDCLERVDNRFELVILAAKRVRQLENGASVKIDVPSSSSKMTVVALREIAEGVITEEEIKMVEAVQDNVLTQLIPPIAVL